MIKIIMSSIIAIIGLSSPSFAADAPAFSALSSSIQGSAVSPQNPGDSIMSLGFKNTSAAKVSLLTPVLSNGKFSVISNRCVAIASGRSCIVTVRLSSSGLSSAQSAVFSSLNSDSVNLSVDVSAKILAPAKLAFVEGSASINFPANSRYSVFSTSIINTGESSARPLVNIPDGMSLLMNRCAIDLKQTRVCVMMFMVTSPSEITYKTISLANPAEQVSNTHPSQVITLIPEGVVAPDPTSSPSPAPSSSPSPVVTITPVPTPDTFRLINVSLDAYSGLSYQFLDDNQNLIGSKSFIYSNQSIRIPVDRSGIVFHWEHLNNDANIYDNVPITFGSYSLNNVNYSVVSGESLTVLASNLQSGNLAAVSVMSSTVVNKSDITMSVTRQPNSSYTAALKVDQPGSTTAQIAQTVVNNKNTGFMRIYQDDGTHLNLTWASSSGATFPGWVISGVSGLSASDLLNPQLDIIGGRLSSAVSIAVNDPYTKSFQFITPDPGVEVDYAVYHKTSTVMSLYQNATPAKLLYADFDSGKFVDQADFISAGIMTTGTAVILVPDDAIIVFNAVHAPTAHLNFTLNNYSFSSNGDYDSMSFDSYGMYDLSSKASGFGIQIQTVFANGSPN